MGRPSFPLFASRPAEAARAHRRGAVHNVTQPFPAPEKFWVAPDSEPGGGAAPPGPAAVEVGISGTISEQRVRQLRQRQRSDTAFPVRLRPMRLVDVMDGAFAVLKSQPRAVTLFI